MFLILPVSVEYKANRMPLVTFWLMGINTAIHLALMILFFTNQAANERVYELFALVPNDSTWHTYLTYNFLHADIIHLLGNMIYLFLFGSCVEDIIGRGKFIAFYLLAGVLAGFGHVFVAHPSTIMMVGASGAISGCMGAFVLLLHNRQIEFKYLFLFFFRLFTGDFFLPAWLVISFWFGLDVLGVLLSSGTEGGGVAYGAHVGGFLAGMAAAPGLRKWVNAESRRKLVEARAREAESTWTATIPPDAQITVLDFEQQHGPYSLAELWGAHQEGQFSEDALYWHEGMEDWAPLNEAL